MRLSPSGRVPDWPDPFDDEASRHVPTTLPQLYRWAERVWYGCGPHRTGLDRAVAYFITGVQIDKAEYEDAEKWTTLLEQVLKIGLVTQLADRDTLAYGDAYLSFYIPFVRFLGCPSCRASGRGTEYRLDAVYDDPRFRFQFRLPEFHATCPECRYRGPWRVEDRDGDLERQLRLVRWNPKYMDPDYDPVSDTYDYFYRFPETYKRRFKVAKPALLHLKRVPLPVLEAVAGDRLFHFDDDAVFHLREPALAGVDLDGRSLPRAVLNHKDVFDVQTLRKHNETLDLDFTVPWRVVSPPPEAQPAAADSGPLAGALATTDGARFKAHVARMVAERRINPATVQVSPFPLQFQVFGADANQFVPADRQDRATAALHANNQVAVELWNGSMQWQAAPIALRLLESDWRPLRTANDDFLAWVIRRAARILSWEPVTGKWKPPSVVDNVERLALTAQLGMSGAFPLGRLFQEMGYDWQQLERSKAEEARFQGKMQAQLQAEADQQGAADQMLAPPAPPGGGGGQPADPAAAAGQGPVDAYLAQTGANLPQSMDDLASAAAQLAGQLLAVPEPVRRQQLRLLRGRSEPLANLTLSELDKQRNATRQQAGANALAALQFGPPPA